MLLATRFEQRHGSSAAGWVAALPLTFAVAVVAVDLDGGAGPAGRFALSAGAHVPAQVAFAVVLVRVMNHCGLLLGAVAGTAAYLVVALVVGPVPAALAVAAAVPALVAGSRGLSGSASEAARAPASARAGTVAITCLAATVVVAAAVGASHLAGPQVGGLVAAFPSISLTLTTGMVRRAGRPAGAAALAGLIRGLPCYLTFCVVVAVTAPVLGLAAVALGIAGCLVAMRVTRPRRSGLVPLLVRSAGAGPDDQLGAVAAVPGVDVDTLVGQHADQVVGRVEGELLGRVA